MLRGESTITEDGAPARMLCVEDDELVQRAIRRGLSEIHVDVVATIAAAKERILAERYRAWLIDINLPDGSGLDLLGWARKRGDRTPALVMTGRVDRMPANEAQELGAEFLYKPYSTSNLRAFVARTLAARTDTRAQGARVDEMVLRLALTRREEDVLRAIARGIDRSDLAHVLGVKENTIKTHIRGLLEKTNHRDLAHLYRELAGPVG